jgi:hypothetical protein
MKILVLITLMICVLGLKRIRSFIPEGPTEEETSPATEQEPSIISEAEMLLANSTEEDLPTNTTIIQCGDIQSIDPSEVMIRREVPQQTPVVNHSGLPEASVGMNGTEIENTHDEHPTNLAEELERRGIPATNATVPNEAEIINPVPTSNEEMVNTTTTPTEGAANTTIAPSLNPINATSSPLPPR